MPDFLLELLSEEIPARMQANASDDLARLFEAELARAGLAAGRIETWATPRRLAMIARDLPAETAAVREETKGPRTSAPPQALEGFLRKTGLTQGQLVERDGVFFAVVDKPGRPTSAVLAEAIPAIVRAFPWPKSMRWGEASASTESLRWVRPLQGIVALLGEEIVDFEIGGIRSGAGTVGHRFHHPGAITIGSANDYLEKLRACHVVVDAAERRRIIAEGAAAAARFLGAELVPDDGLLHENAGLTEWPHPILGSFDPAFLELPREVIQLTMRTNQKYFALTEGEGNLAPHFVCVANIDPGGAAAVVAAGNERVLAARLSDARYFWEQDLKVPLEEQAKKLSQIVFHEKLGTVADKVERVAKLARWLVEEGIVKPPLPPAGGNEPRSGERGGPVGESPPGENPSPDPSHRRERSDLAGLAERAARLCKADLVTGLVGEFPELQGVIGGHLARAQGEPDEIADAIRDHYKPAGQNDEAPTAPVTVAVSLADKLDNLLSFFAVDMLPTGSKDPFALRRAALGYLQLIQTNKIKVRVRHIAEFWSAATAPDNLGGRLADFFQDRLGVQLRESGVRYDFVQASGAWRGATDDRLDRVEARARALNNFLLSSEGSNLLAGYKRAANILKKENWQSEPDRNKPLAYDTSDVENALIAAIDSADPRARAAVEAEDFEGAMAALASLRAPVDAFFDKVTVNDPDPIKRAARLDLLARMRAAVHEVADFSRIEG